MPCDSRMMKRHPLKHTKIGNFYGGLRDSRLNRFRLKRRKICWSTCQCLSKLLWLNMRCVEERIYSGRIYVRWLPPGLPAWTIYDAFRALEETSRWSKMGSECWFGFVLEMLSSSAFKRVEMNQCQVNNSARVNAFFKSTWSHSCALGAKSEFKTSGLWKTFSLSLNTLFQCVWPINRFKQGVVQ